MSALHPLHPGVTYEGTVSFISPIVDPSTRTTKVRVNVDNSKGILKPGLFVKGVIKADVFGEGNVIGPDLAGKFICPMHPEVVKDSKGQCTICGMNLMSAKELGFVAKEKDTELPLVIPSTAPLVTGTRAVVYVKRTNESVFEARSVVLGPETDNYFVIISGLKEGEEVVTNGEINETVPS